MKVALFTQDMSGGAFGAVFSGLANALAANGVTAIELLTVKGDMAAPEHPFPATVAHVRLPGGHSGLAIPALRRHLLRSRPDALIAGPIIPNLAAVVAGRWARAWPGKLILSHHHPVRLARSQSWKNSVTLVRLLYRFADGSFAVSPAVREEVIEVARLDPARVACIPNALPPLAATRRRLSAPLAGGGATKRAGVRHRERASNRSRTCRSCSMPSPRSRARSMPGCSSSAAAPSRPSCGRGSARSSSRPSPSCSATCDRPGPIWRPPTLSSSRPTRRASARS